MKRHAVIPALPLAVVVGLLAVPATMLASRTTQDTKKTDQKKPAQEEPDDKLTEAERKEVEMKGCGPKETKHSADTDKKTHPVPEPPADKALLFVVRPTMMGNKIQTKLAVDGQWVGVNRGNNYFFFTLDPGEHFLCSTAENRSVMKLTVEAGKTYYVQQKIRMGFMKATNILEAIDEREGKVALTKTHPSVSVEKK